MTDKIKETAKLDPAIRDQRISRKARDARRLERLAMYGTPDDKKAARRAQLERDTYIDVFVGEP